MRQATIQPHQTLAVPYSLAADSFMRFVVSADHPLDIHLIDDAGLVKYKASMDAKFDSWGSFHSKTNCDFSAVLPVGMRYHLVLHNNSEEKVSVQYDALMIR